MEKLSKNIDINMNYLSKLLCINKSFDLITRVIELKGHKAAIYCIDGFVKSDTLEKLLEFMFKKTDSFKPVSYTHLSEVSLYTSDSAAGR